MKVLQDLYTRIHAGSGAKPTSNQNVGTAKTKRHLTTIYIMNWFQSLDFFSVLGETIQYSPHSISKALLLKV